MSASDVRTDRVPANVRRLFRFVLVFISLGALTGGLFAFFDALLRGHAPKHWLLHVFGLGSAAGALAGATLGLLLGLSGMLRTRMLRALLWLLGAMAWSGFAMHQLGVLSRLSGPYARLAWAAMAAIVLVALFAAASGLLLTPELASDDAEGPYFGTWVGRMSARTRRLFGAGWLGFALCAIACDALLFLELYPFIQEVLLRSARLAATGGLFALGLQVSRLHLTSLAGVPAALLALFTLNEQHGALVSAMRMTPLLEVAIDDLRAIADTDADGFPLWLGGGDCAPFDPEVHPGAHEVVANGIDDNCRLGELAQDVPRKAPRITVAQAVEPRPSVVLITVDTLRADHLGSYGYERKTSPHIDRWFASGLRCTDAFAPGSYTTITLPALMRGVYARHLSWVAARQTNQFRLFPVEAQPALRPNERWLNAHLLSVDARAPPLSALLSGAGYQTWAVVDDGGSGLLAPPLAGPGFKTFHYVPSQSRMLLDPAGDAQVAQLALTQLEQRGPQPFFLWLHFYGVHAPDAAHADVPSFGDDMVARYDHEIAHVDHQLHSVFELLTRIEQERPLITVLTSDHGERFTETGRAHGSNLAEEEIHVPLFLRGPGVPQGTLSHVVSLVDVVPTLLVRLGLSDGTGFDGLNLLDQAAHPKRKAVLADVWRYGADGHLEFDRVTAVNVRRRFVFEPGTNSRRLYRRGVNEGLLLLSDDVLESEAFRYLEHTGPQPLSLLP